MIPSARVGRSTLAVVLRAAAPLAIIALAVFMLVRFPPSEYAFYPQCPIHQLLHIDCPGCGTTRAFAALLRGHFMEALRFNALTTLLLPPAIIYAVTGYRCYLRAEFFRWPRPSDASIYAALAVVAVFTLLRNLPL